MFVRTQTRRRWLSHLFSSQQCRVLFLALTLATPGAFAADPSPTPASVIQEAVDANAQQLPREKNSLIDVVGFKRPKGETDWKEFLRNTHASYYISIMGPRIAGSGNETYNIFLQDVSSVQLFHAWQLGFQVNPDLQLGFKVSATQNIADGVVGRTGTIYHRDFVPYDLLIYGNLPNLVKIDGWNIFTSFSMSLSTSQLSKDARKITGLEFSQSWSIKSSPSDWTFGFTLYANPQFYNDPMPTNYSYRQTFNGNIGHFISYRVSDIFKLQSTSTFDAEYRAPAPGWGSGLEDRSRLSFTIFPRTGDSVFVSLGGYFQFLVWKPSMETSILGADFSVGF